MNILQKLSIRKYLNKDSLPYKLFVIGILLVLLFVLVIVSLSFGSSSLEISDIIQIVFKGKYLGSAKQIIKYVRIPRTIAAILAGSGLALSGLILQSVLNNALASPTIIGVNSGAGLFTALATVFFHANIKIMPLAAFLGAFLATIIVYLVARQTGASRTTIVLAGTAISSLLGAMTDTILILFPDTAIDRTSFVIGGLSGVTMDRLKIPAAIIFLSFIIALIFSYDLNVLTLGDQIGKSLGLNINLCRFLFIILSSLLAGSVISFAGLLGFVGLIVPHICRILVGYDNRILIPTSVLLGSCFALFCDILARTLFAPYEIPVGIIMSFLGSPFFIYLLFKNRRRLKND